MTAQGAFGCLDLPARAAKPRSTGLSSLYDYGLPNAMVASWLEVIAPVVDTAKLADHTGLIQRFPLEWVRQRVDLYHRHGIKVYPGGVPYEIAVQQGRVERYFDAVAEAGLDGVEISEDLIGVQPRKTKDAHIGLALARGLTVKSELGLKFPGSQPTFSRERLVEMAREDLAAGVAMVILEHAELHRFMATAPDEIRHLHAEVGAESITFEAGGPSGWPDLPIWLIRTLGDVVNLENLPGDSHVRYLMVEAFRMGMHRDIGYPFLVGPGADAGAAGADR